MWKILGEEAVIPTAPDVWRKRVVELSKRKKDREKFVSLLDKGEMRVVLDGVRETWMFIVNLPDKTRRSDLEFVATWLSGLSKSAKAPLLELDGVAQPVSIVVTSEEYTDDYKFRSGHRKQMLDEEEENLKKQEEKQPREMPIAKKRP